MGTIIRFFKYLIKYFCWRLLNRNNNTYIKTLFPFNKVKVGRYTYGPLHIYSWGHPDEFLNIGSYCSIAPGVHFLLSGNHPINGLLSFPVKYFYGRRGCECLCKGKIEVGHDVWIGMGASIVSGVSIGNGAVIAANSMVVKDIPAYAIVAGNPAKIVKYRFSESNIKRLQEINFDKLDVEFLLKNLSLVYEELNDESIDIVLNRQGNIE